MSTEEGATRRPVSAPPLSLLAMEALWPLEAAAFVAASPWFRLLPHGDGHPVLVLPGFTADDTSTVPLRCVIERQGYASSGWELGRNVGPTRWLMSGLRSRLREVADVEGRSVSIIGWSLGGTYARILARETPELVRQVISIGSPYRMIDGDESVIMALWRRYEHRHDADVDLGRIAEQERSRLEVPATSIYSRRDGIAPWQTCIDVVGPIAENIEVWGAHSALGANPAVAVAVLDRLAQPERKWRPFRPPLMLRPWFPHPVSWIDVSREIRRDPT
jgi:pimeloyl-ACP methyl ester carboxylesterase